MVTFPRQAMNVSLNTEYRVLEPTVPPTDRPTSPTLPLSPPRRHAAGTIHNLVASNRKPTESRPVFTQNADVVLVGHRVLHVCLQSIIYNLEAKGGGTKLISNDPETLRSSGLEVGFRPTVRELGSPATTQNRQGIGPTSNRARD